MKLNRIVVNDLIPDGNGVFTRDNYGTPEPIWYGWLGEAPTEAWEKADKVHVSQATFDRIKERMSHENSIGSVH